MLRNAYLLYPSLLSLIAVVSASLPWGAPAMLSLALPLIALAVIFYWGIHRPGQLPSPLVFLFGVLTDLATDGPLGYWAMNFLVGYAIAVYGPLLNGGRRDGVAGVLLFAGVILVVTVLGWGITSLFFLRTMPMQPQLLAGGIALLSYPILAVLLAPLDRAVGLALQRISNPQDDWL
jgi:rod shape-determining protein MreD